jgi:hypothetical protein
LSKGRKVLFLKKIRNIVSLFVISTILCFSSTAFGSTLTNAQSSIQKTALSHMENLGVIDKLSNGSVDINKAVSRDIFAKMLIVSSGLQTSADALKYQSIFPDVKANNNMTGYVNAAVNKNLLAGLADRKFHPEQNVTFAQVCTAAVRALGYTDTDLKGVWPQNYIEEAKSLKLLDGISLKNNDGVSRGIAATIIERLLNTNIKKVSPQDADKTLLSAGGVFTDCIILGNSTTSNRLDNNQILTDQGIFYSNGSKTSYVVGNKYRLLLDGDKIKKVYYTLKTLKSIVIDSVDKTKVTYSEKNSKVNMTLPDKVTYYYDGVKQTYSDLNTILSTASSITFAYNDDKVGFEYAVINSLALTGYADYIILGNSTTSDRLDSNQILTDKGILYLDDKTIKVIVGHKYRMLLDSNDNILKINKDLRTVKSIKVDSITNSIDGTLDNVITYTENGKSINMTLPDKVIYYKDGTKLTYTDALTALQGDTSVVFGNNGNNVGYEYGVILTNSQGAFADYIVLGNSQTSVRLSSNQILTDKGIFYLTDSNVTLEVGHMYRMLMNNNNIMKVDKDERSILSIKVDSVAKSADGTLENVINYTDNGKSTNLTLPDKVNYYYDGAKQTYAAALDLLKGDTSIIFGNNENNIGYDYAVILSNSEGAYGDYVILGNSATISRLEQNQILTDKGILYIPDNKTIFNIGNKYRLLVNNDTIENVQTSDYTYKSFVVSSISGSNITYMSNNVQSTMVLPDKVSYYYQGVKQTYDNLKNIIQGESTIIYANNTNNVGYEYAVIVDPVYSKPEIAMNVKAGDTKIGSIDLSSWSPVVKNGEFINPYSIQNGDVVYQVSDLGNTSNYILALDSKIEGKITAILPNRLYPTTIQIDNKNYDISGNMNLSSLNNKYSVIKIGDVVDIYLGYDSKIVNVDYPEGQDNANYAFVLNYTSTLNNGITTYTVKLLKYDGSIQTYNVNIDPTDLKGELVSFTNIDTITVALSGFTNIYPQDTNINLSDMKIDDNYVSDNVRVFDLISNNSGSDADVKVLNWNDLYSGKLEAGKVLYLNKAGAFNNINVVVLNDVFNEKNSFGVVKSVKTTTSGGKTINNCSIGVNGKDYQLSVNSNDSGEIDQMDAVSVALVNGQIGSFSGVSLPNISGTTLPIQAIDSKEIMLNNIVYRLTDDVAIYYKDTAGNITTKAAGDIDISKTYSKVSLFLDKALSYGGKIRLIVITE